jgi:hypothetical protein
LDFEKYIDITLEMDDGEDEMRWVSKPLGNLWPAVISAVLDKYRPHWIITEGAGGWKFAPKPSP